MDLLIGVDYAELHFSFKDIRGNPGEPVARLTTQDGAAPDLLVAWNVVARGESADTNEIRRLLHESWRPMCTRESREVS